MTGPPVFIDTPGARLAVYEGGATDHPIVLLHGGPGVPDYLGDVANILRSTHRVIRFDQRGTGQSTCRNGRYALQDYVDDLEAIRRAYGIERLKLFGHSWGGLLAQLYGSEHPDRVAQMCLSNSAIGLGSDWLAMERAVMAHNRRRGGFGGFVLLGLDQAMAMLPGTAGDRGARRMMARVWRNYFDPPNKAPAPSDGWLAGIHREPIFATRRAAIAADGAQLRGDRLCPSARVLIIFGESDIYGDTQERLMARYPAARVVTIPGAGHVPWLQNHARFAEEVTAFFAIDGCDGSSPADHDFEA